MRIRTKSWLTALTVSLIVVLVGIIYVSFFGAPYTLRTMLDRSTVDLSQEDYDAYSGFIEDYFSRGHGSAISSDESVSVAEHTISLQNSSAILPLDVVALGPEDAGRDLFRQNERSWHLQSHFSGSHRIVLASQATDRSLRLSRIGFDGNRKLGLLYYQYGCGMLCGQSGWVLLDKRDGRWRIEQFGREVGY